jgi:hypothetical protein
MIRSWHLHLDHYTSPWPTTPCSGPLQEMVVTKLYQQILYAAAVTFINSAS